MKIVYIYGLYDPRNLELKYIGKARNLAVRLEAHISLAKNDIVSPKSVWIRKLTDLNLKPVILIIEKTDENNWGECEIKWINEFREKGIKLFNIADGGPNPPDHSGEKQTIQHILKRVKSRKNKGNYAWSEELKVKMSNSKKGTKVGKENPFYGKHHSEETKEKLRVKNSNYKPTEETRKKISEAVRKNPTKYWLGKNLSKETIEKIRMANKGRKFGKDFSEKLRQANLGKHHSEETKQKLREINLGKHHSEETKLKIGLISKGKPKSNETKAKLGASIKKAWENEEYKEKMKEMRKKVQKEKWDDLDYRRKMLEAQKRRREREKLEKGL